VNPPQNFISVNKPQALYYIFAIFYNEIGEPEEEMSKAGRYNTEKRRKNAEKMQKGLGNLRFKLYMTI
ncbi:MAG: hypothetical protein IIV09_10750, partial [Selenomonadaceae bacterium]|nr:hypothetical protein [Selenomonadaceae bacterium]